MQKTTGALPQVIPSRTVVWVFAFSILFAIFFVTRSIDIIWGDTFSLSDDEFNTFRDSSPLTSLVSFSIGQRTSYYLITKQIITAFGYSDVVLRLVAYSFSVASFVFFFVYIGRLYGLFVTVFFSLIMTFTATHLYFSGLARQYSVTFVLVGAFILVLTSSLQRRDFSMSRVMSLALLGSAAVVFHPTSVIPIGASLLYLAVHLIVERDKRPKPLFCVLGGTLVVLIGLWLVYFFIQLGGTSNFELNLGRSIYVIGSAISDITLSLFIFSTLYGVYLYRRDRRPDVGYWLCLIVISYVGLSIIALVHKQAAYGQYIYPVLFVFILLGAVAIDDIIKRYEGVDRLIIVLLLFGVVLSGNGLKIVDYFRDGDRFDFKGAVKIVEQQAESHDILLSYPIKTTNMSRASLYSERITTKKFEHMRRRKFTGGTYRELGKYIDWESECTKLGGVWFIVRDVEPAWGFDSPLSKMTAKFATVGVRRFDHHNKRLNIYKVTLPACRDDSYDNEDQ